MPPAHENSAAVSTRNLHPTTPHPRKRRWRFGLRRVPRPVIILGFVSLFTDFSSEMIYPLLPVFLSATLGATATVIGFVEGLAETTAAWTKVFAGVWTDRLPSRKPLILAGYGVSGFLRPLIGLAASWPVVAALRFTDRLGKGVRNPPRDALIADVTARGSRGASFGFHRAMDHAGAVLGPLTAGLLLLIPTMGLRAVFLLAFVPSIAAFLTLSIGLRERPRTREVEPSSPRSDGRTLSEIAAAWRAMDQRAKSLFVALFVFTLGNSTDAFLLLRLKESGVSAASISFLWALHHVVKMATAYVGGAGVDRFGARKMLVSGWGFYAVIYLLMALPLNTLQAIGVFLSYGIYFGFAEPAERVLVADASAQAMRGRAYGIYHFVVGIAALPASLIFGWIWTAVNFSYAFICGAGFALLATAIVLFTSRRV